MAVFRFGVVVFPGSTCEQDAVQACRSLGYQADYIWHTETDLSGYDAIILPGGYSFGGYLRGGAIASHSPVMSSVASYASQGRPVLGICDGFQILCEAGLLPGLLLRNQNLRHIGKMVPIQVEESVCQWISHVPGTVLSLPLSHSHGDYYCDDLGLGRLEAKGQVVLRYCSEDGASSSVTSDIAGICNERGNVFGMMPYPERVTDGLVGSDGRSFFTSIIQRLEESI
ncbi:MAG: phosphoribosylformylglycinamidine synthase subunit PurQ [Coriobacteriia bacterium]|nr:phosphoribosylformylglycinamidine synthase subunit PurQ [Coriobacteriia bacterium]